MPIASELSRAWQFYYYVIPVPACRPPAGRQDEAGCESRDIFADACHSEAIGEGWFT